MTIRLGVIGAAGKMGVELCRAADEDPELEVVARVTSSDPRDVLSENRAEVAADFTTPKAVKGNVRWLIEHGIDAVVGTTGLSEQDVDEFRRLATDYGTSVFIAPNFALGAVLMMKFAAQAAPYFEAAEIVERHHARKLDKPSGTALRTSELMDAGRTEPWSKPIEIHSLRLPGSVAHQDVVLGSPGEILTIRHDAIDRACFMPGVLLAVKKVSSLHGVTVGLEHLLDL